MGMRAYFLSVPALADSGVAQATESWEYADRVYHASSNLPFKTFGRIPPGCGKEGAEQRFSVPRMLLRNYTSSLKKREKHPSSLAETGARPMITLNEGRRILPDDLTAVTSVPMTLPS